MPLTAARRRAPARNSYRFRKNAHNVGGMFEGLIVDNFAGIGGASIGIEKGRGRAVDLAINHDHERIASHSVNHPHTRHIEDSVWRVHVLEECAGRPVDLAWFSPDCCDFSRAKGGTPVRKYIRGLAWIVIRWARMKRPLQIFLENVREFQDWGPVVQVKRGRRYLWHVAALGPKGRRREILGPHFKTHEARDFKLRHRQQGHRVDPAYQPDPEKRGITFNQFVGYLRGLGYTVEWKELNAADYGAPTTRRRLFMIARCDGEPIVWPAPTHGRGPGLKPYRTAAECIDWSIPCPSIFTRKRPLALKTRRRIALGIRRYVIEAAKPFIVRCAHGEGSGDTKRWGHGSHSVDEPLPTVTGSNDFAAVAPTLVQTGYGERTGQSPRAIDLQAPLGTVVAGGVKQALVSPSIIKVNHGKQDPLRGQPVDRTLATITGKHGTALMSAVLTKYQGDKGGEPARAQTVDEPVRTVVTENRHGLVATHLSQFYGEVVGKPMTEPVPTVTGIDHNSLVGANLVKFRGESHGVDIQNPMPTVTSGAGAARPAGAAHALGLSAASIVRIGQTSGNGKYVNEVEEPLTSIVSKQEHLVAAAALTHFRGSNRGSGGDVRTPLPAVTAQGTHVGYIAAYLIKFYSSGSQWQSMHEPLHTVTAKERFGLLAVELSPHDAVGAIRVGRFMCRYAGSSDPYAVQPGSAKELRAKMRACRRPAAGFRPDWLVIGRRAYAVATVVHEGAAHFIVGIGLRMLVPRELARAQGFPDTYVLTGSNANQVAGIGNSVPPIMAEVLTRANAPVEQKKRVRYAAVG